MEAVKKREEAAKLRLLAASQKSNAAAHLRQADNPIYPGQSAICIDKAAIIEALADKNLATAARLDAEAGAMESAD